MWCCIALCCLVWSVTIAEEIEQSGMEGRVVMSESTHEHCHQAFSCRLLKPLIRSAGGAVSRIPRYEVLDTAWGGGGGGGGVGGNRRRWTERVDMLNELSALPKVVLDILDKVREAASTPTSHAAGDEAAAAATAAASSVTVAVGPSAASPSAASGHHRERVEAVAAGWSKPPHSSGYRNLAINELAQANGHHSSSSSSGSANGSTNTSSSVMPALSEDEKERD